MAVYKDTEEGITIVYYHCKSSGRIFVIDVWLARKWKFTSKAEKRKKLIANTYKRIKAKHTPVLFQVIDPAEFFTSEEYGPLRQRLHDARS